MKELKVLQLTDAVGGEDDYYSKQLQVVTEGKDISETNYFLTYRNIMVDIDNDIDAKNIHVKNAMELGAIIKSMYFVEDNLFSHHIYNFKAIGIWDGVEYGEEHGIVFELENDAIRYDRYVSLVKNKIEVNGYEVIEKESAIKIVEETSLEELAKLLISKQRYKVCGSICYLDLEEGIIKVVEDTGKLIDTDIIIAKLHKNDEFGGAILNGLYNEEYYICILTSMLELGEFRQAIEKFYNTEEEQTMKQIIVERVEEFTDKIKRYKVITQEEAIKIIGNFNIAENVVDNSIYECGYTIEIDLETGEIYTTIDNGTFRLRDTTTIRHIYYKKPYHDFSPISEVISEYSEFEAFEEQYQDWIDEVDREYDYEFDNKCYRDVCDAFIVEVLGEDIDEFLRNDSVETLEAEINSEIYEDTYKFYDEAKVIMEL